MRESKEAFPQKRQWRPECVGRDSPPGCGERRLKVRVLEKWTKWYFQGFSSRGSPIFSSLILYPFAKLLDRQDKSLCLTSHEVNDAHRLHCELIYPPEGRRRRGRQRTRWLDGITDSMDVSLSKLRETRRTRKPDLLQSLGSQRTGYDLSD